jgi:hypothetical protein
MCAQVFGNFGGQNGVGIAGEQHEVGSVWSRLHEHSSDQKK